MVSSSGGVVSSSGGVVSSSGGVVPSSGRSPLSVGVVQLRHCERLPVSLGEALNTPGGWPEPFRNAWMLCWSGWRHSEREAQCVPSETLEW